MMNSRQEEEFNISGVVCNLYDIGESLGGDVLNNENQTNDLDEEWINDMFPPNEIIEDENNIIIADAVCEEGYNNMLKQFELEKVAHLNNLQKRQVVESPAYKIGIEKTKKFIKFCLVDISSVYTIIRGNFCII